MSDPFDLSFSREPGISDSASMKPGYMEALNPEQKAAVEATDGPVLVLAGAGTGKTRVLTTRLAHLLHQGRARPGEILAVTFTNKAAREMISRVSSLIKRPAEGLWLGTFHSMGAKILRRHAEMVGLKSDFTIIDSDDQTRLLKQLLREADIDEKRWPARTLSLIIQRWKDRGVRPQQVHAQIGENLVNQENISHFQTASGDINAYGFANQKAPDLYKRYQERLKSLNAADFGDLLLHNLTIFTSAPEVLEEYERRFKYILVDEYQDTNVAQYLWLRLLARTRHNICCVGDDDQSIYSWRGAQVGNILRFEEDFDGAKIVRLERNYRSTGHILEAASGLIAHNKERLGKTLWTEIGEGEKICITGCWDSDEEARLVGEKIEDLQRRGENLDQIAILVRAGFQTRSFEERFLSIDLPYRVIGGLRFYERQEIRDAVAYLRLISNNDDDLAFERIVNVPRRGIGGATLRYLHDVARSSNGSLYQATEKLIGTDEINNRQRTVLQNFIKKIQGWKSLVSQMPHNDILEVILEESGYKDMWKSDKSPQAPGRLENLDELVNALPEFESLGHFLEHVSLVMERDVKTDQDMVNLMTLHGAKGLEFDSVFLPGWEEDLFPHKRSLDESGGLEEERRLAYVGLTRARKRIHILSALRRQVHNQWQDSYPSRFLNELSSKYTEIENVSGYPIDNYSEELLPTSRSQSFDQSPVNYRKSDRRKIHQIQTESLSDDSMFSVGTRIFHQKFGYGTVQSVEGNKLTVTFEKAGEKKVLDQYVQRA